MISEIKRYSLFSHFLSGSISSLLLITNIKILELYQADGFTILGFIMVILVSILLIFTLVLYIYNRKLIFYKDRFVYKHFLKEVIVNYSTIKSVGLDYRENLNNMKYFFFKINYIGCSLELPLNYFHEEEWVNIALLFRGYLPSIDHIHLNKLIDGELDKEIRDQSTVIKIFVFLWIVLLMILAFFVIHF